MPRAPFQVMAVPFRRGNDGAVAFAIFRRKDAGYWQVIAGGGEDVETPQDSVRREAQEEAGIPISAKYYALKTSASVPVTQFLARDLWPEDQYVTPCHYFAVEASGIEITLSYEHSEYRWMSYDEAYEALHWDSDKTALWELRERLRHGDLRPV